MSHAAPQPRGENHVSHSQCWSWDLDHGYPQGRRYARAACEAFRGLALEIVACLGLLALGLGIRIVGTSVL